MGGFVYAKLSLNWLTRRLQTIRKKSNERTSEYLGIGHYLCGGRGGGEFFSFSVKEKT